MKLTKETASEFDFMICLDASGSMTEPSTRYEGKSRWEEGKELITGITAELHQYDSDGIDVVVFGGDVQMHNNVTPAKVAEIFASRGPRGGTPLAEALAEVVKTQANRKKNTVAIVFTDGEPSDKKKAVETIIKASNALESDENLTFLFVQIGSDPGATRFLKSLDDDLKGQGAKFDIVDTVTGEEAERLAPLDMIEKAIAD